MSTVAQPAALVPRRPARRRRWPLIVGCLLLLASVPLGSYFYLAWSAQRDEEEAVAEIERLDPRWRFADIVADRKPIPDDENPAVIVVKVGSLTRPSGYDVGVENQWLFQDRPSSVHRLTNQQIAVLRASLGKHAEALTLARTLSAFRGEGRYPITPSPDYVTTTLGPLQRARNVMYLLEHDAMLRAEDGDAPGALESSQSILVASRAIGDEPYLIAALIRMAGESITVSALERTLAQGEAPSEQLKAMQELLVKEIDAGFLLQALRGERGGTDLTIETLRKGTVPLSAIRGSTGSSSMRDWLEEKFPRYMLNGRAEQLRLLNQAVEAAKLPVEKQGRAFEAVDAARKESSAPLVRLLGFSVMKVSLAHRRTRANMRCAVVALAAERFRLQEIRWPPTMDALVQGGYLAAVPLDPFDGQPLRYKLTADGVTVYSVGHDGIDNGGAINRENPLAPNCDQGIRLWNPELRRLPPLPVQPRGEG